MAKAGQRKFIKRVAITLVSLSLMLLTLNLSASHSPLLSPAYAQRFNPNNVWQQVYEQLPDLPLENQYISRETGDIVSDNTLVDRFIRYHIYVQGRPPIYRLDWKQTLADYLGVNEFIEATTYPSGDTLTTNPMEGDIAAINSLNRAQRAALVETIVNIFNAAYSTPATAPQSPDLGSPSPQPSSTSPAPPPVLREPQPGDAELLSP